jgi:DNA-binding NarL/FixJ family response regulator
MRDERNNENPIRVLLADDHPVTRSGIRAILDKAPDIQVVGEAGNGIEAQRLVAELAPKILLLDLQMPGPQPSEVAMWVRDHCPETVTLVLTAHDRDAYLAAMIEAETTGFVTKEEAPERLLEAIRHAARGEVLFNRDQLIRARRWRKEVGERWESLTERERDVLILVATGKTNQEIAQELQITAKTVSNHVSSILDKLGMASRTEASLWAVREGLID